jgi:hypothetical protein|tara:strand:- start:979 stop:1179 length:201 start_codon:yes stop_codon:yes gene_type:complete
MNKKSTHSNNVRQQWNLSWRVQPRGFPYGEDFLKDKQYLEDRAEVFRKNGNGWWCILNNINRTKGV